MCGRESRILFGRRIGKQTNGVKIVRQELLKSGYIWCLPGKRDATLKNTLGVHMRQRILGRPDSFVQLYVTSRTKQKQRKRESEKQKESPSKLNLNMCSR